MPVTRRPARTLAGLVVTALLASSAPTATAASTFGPQLPDNPFDGPVGTAAVHGDSGGSNTTPLPGPGTRHVVARPIRLGGACPTIVVGSDDLPLTLCSQTAGRTSRVYLLDPNSGAVLASMAVTGDNPNAYLDNAGRLVLVDGGNKLVRVAHTRNKLGLWNLAIAESLSLASVVPDGDAVTGLAPAYDGKVWFTTAKGSIGVVDTATRAIKSLPLPDGEHVTGAISTAPQGTAVVTTAALYLLGQDAAGMPVVKFRVPHGGDSSTPTFFGPATGGEYLAFVDNSGRQAQVTMVRTASGTKLCSTPVFAPDAAGEANSPIGAGRTVIASGADGMTRVDIRTDESGCAVKWHNAIVPESLPRLSTTDGLIMTVARTRDLYSYTAVDATDGALSSQQSLGATSAYAPEPAAGTITSDGVLYQGTAGGIQRIS